MPSRSDIEHLLRRTEFVARPHRVNQLESLPTLDACVDDILQVPVDPGTVTFAQAHQWHRGNELIHFWLDRMAHDSPRPIQEKMGFFWHGHFCSDVMKTGSIDLMHEQIQLFRREGFGNLRSLAKRMSTQVAMLRYLDNNQNKRTSPNQNFARELMELFLLGVGNYTEADVEAGTAAWTGHTDNWETGAYVWRSDWHDGAPKSYLGRTINLGGDWTSHGAETIDVILGNGVVPSGAAVVANRGRPTAHVAAEFIARKLWTAFAGTTAPDGVVAGMRDAALGSDFSIQAMVRAMLLRAEFYSDDVRRGLVRSPVEYVVALMSATGLRSVEHTPIWLLEGMGQRPFSPPDVSGWKHNGYWVNASAMAQRATAARHYAWRTMPHYWDGDGLVHLAGGTLSQTEVSTTYLNNPAGLVDRVLQLLRITVTPSTRDALVAYTSSVAWWERNLVVTLALLSPDMNLA